MSEVHLLQGLRLRGGFIIVSLEYVAEPMVDAVGRSAIAKTQVIGRKFHITILSNLSDAEESVTLYHEILEAMTVAAAEAPASVQDYCEGDFEKAAYEAHERLGPASAESLSTMLQSYGFREE